LLISFTHEQEMATWERTVEIAGEVLTRDAFDHMMESFGWLRAIAIEIPEDVIYVEQLAVVPAHRGMAIAPRMLNDEFKRAQSQGFKAVELDVNDDNAVARKVYEHLGMYLFSTVSAPLLEKHGFETHHRMRIEL
jgi:ribosomal protein S18 acetylase RimI-like enzyme